MFWEKKYKINPTFKFLNCLPLRNLGTSPFFFDKTQPFVSIPLAKLQILI